MAKEILRASASQVFDTKTAVFFDSFYFVAEFVHVCNKGDARRLAVRSAGAQMKNQISGFVGNKFLLRPVGKLLRYRFAYGGFVAAGTVGFGKNRDERSLRGKASAP